jgi:hypothetical protein
MYCTSLSQESQRSCPPKVHPPNFVRGGRRVDMMSTLVKGDQEILHLKEHPRGQCLGTSVTEPPQK